MSSTYAGQLKQAVRRFSLGTNQIVTIEDKLTGGSGPAQVRWGMTTPAKLQVDGSNAAWLLQDGKRLRMQVTAPGPIKIESWAANPPPNDFDAPNPGISVVGFIVPLKPGEEATLKVELIPDQSK
jgi:hypothetical protein